MTKFSRDKKSFLDNTGPTKEVIFKMIVTKAEELEIKSFLVANKINAEVVNVKEL